MRAKTIHKQEQYKLIMECRTSGLTDYQWCQEKGIRPGTFYNWIARFRKNGYPEFPNSLSRKSPHKAVKHEVVKLELDNTDNSCVISKGIDQNACITKSTNISDEATIEILTSCASIRFSNNVNPQLLELVMGFVGGNQ